jgi:hypothetical protein
MTYRARTFNGHDYATGRDVELSRARWRERIANSECTRRIGSDLLAFARNDHGMLSLIFEVYDEGSLGNPKPSRRGTVL